MKASRVTDLTEFLDKESKRRSSSLSSESKGRSSSLSSDSGQSKSSDDNIIYPSSLPPEWSVTITSEHNLQLTLTKTSLEILMELQKVTIMLLPVVTILQ